MVFANVSFIPLLSDLQVPPRPQSHSNISLHDLVPFDSLEDE